MDNLKGNVLGHNPGLVFIEFAINGAATKHHISLEDCEANFDTMIRRMREQNPDIEIVLQTMDPAWDSPASAPKKYASDRPNLEAYYAVDRQLSGL